MMFWASGLMRSAGITLPGKGWPVTGSLDRDVRPREVAVAHGRGGHVRPRAAEDGLVVRSLVGREEEGPAGLERAPEARSPAVLVGVAVGVAALHPRLLLVVGERVQAGSVEVVEDRALVAVAAPLRGHDHDARETAVLGAVGVGEDRSSPRSRRGPGRSCRRCRRSRSWRPGRPGRSSRRRSGRPRNWMSSLPPRTFGFRSRNDWMSRLLRGRSRSCCSSSPSEMAWLSSVMLLVAFRGHGDGLVDAAELERDVHRADAGGAEHDARLLEFLEVRGHHLDAVGPGPEVGGLVAPLGVGLDGTGHPRRLVDDEDGGARDRGPLRIGDGAADGAQERLGGHRTSQRRNRQLPDGVLASLPPRHAADALEPVEPAIASKR